VFNRNGGTCDSPSLGPRADTITVVDFAGRASEESVLIKEATAASQERTKVLMDEDTGVDSSYGRKLTVDLPNNSERSMSAIFFKDNHLSPGLDCTAPEDRCA
jgi:hypothetical protein